MPQEWNNIWCVTEDELVPLHFGTYESLKKSLQRHADKPYGIKKVRSGGNGRQLLISFDSLPREMQNAIGDPRKPGHILELYYSTDEAAVRFFTKYEYPDGAGMQFKKQEEYITNASVLQACAKLKAAREQERRGKGGSLKGIMDTICADARSFNPILQQRHSVSHTLPESSRRFKDDFKDFFKPAGEWPVSYAALISGKDRNQNARVVTDHYLAILTSLFAGHTRKPTRTEVSNQWDAFLNGHLQIVNEDTAEAYDPAAFKKLSDSTIVGYLGVWEHKGPTELKRAAKDSRQLMLGRYSPAARLKRPDFAGQVLSVDDRQPPFLYQTGKNSHDRVWFYLAVDVYSDAIVAFVYGRDKKGILLDFYRQVVRNCAELGLPLPAELEAEAFGNTDYAKSFLQNGYLFEHVRIEANKARAKYAEGVWNQMRYDDGPGGEKDDPRFQGRPYAKREAQQMGPGGEGKAAIMRYEEIVDASRRRIMDWNNSESPRHPGKSRWDVWTGCQRPDAKPIPWAALLPAGIGHWKRCITWPLDGVLADFRAGRWCLGNGDQLLCGEALIRAMREAAGEAVDLCWLEGNDEQPLKILVYRNDRLIAEAVPQPYVPRSHFERQNLTPQGRADLEAWSAYEATIRSFLDARKKAIEPVLVLDGRTRIINRNYQLPNLRRYQPTEGDPEILTDGDSDEGLVPVPMPQPGIRKSLKDRL